MGNNISNTKKDLTYDRARMDAICRIQMASDTEINYLRDYSEFKKPENVDDDFWLNICTKKIIKEYDENKRKRKNEKN